MSEYQFKAGDKVELFDDTNEDVVRVIDYVGSANVTYTVTTPVNSFEKVINRDLFETMFVPVKGATQA
jgi:calcineurin-like phosphoesterase